MKAAPAYRLAKLFLDSFGVGEHPPEDLRDAEYDEQFIDAARIRAAVTALRDPCKPPVRGDGCIWGDRAITWPDRVPGLITWSGQQSLAKIVRKHQDALPDLDIDPLTWTITEPGPSGLISASARDAIDVGYSPNDLGEGVLQWPAVELMAIKAIDKLPLVSWGRRDCGVVMPGNRLLRWTVEPRAGGYYHRWGHVHAEHMGEVIL